MVRHPEGAPVPGEGHRLAADGVDGVHRARARPQVKGQAHQAGENDAGGEEGHHPPARAGSVAGQLARQGLERGQQLARRGIALLAVPGQAAQDDVASAAGTAPSSGGGSRSRMATITSAVLGPAKGGGR